MLIISHFLRKNAAALEKAALNDLEKEIRTKYNISIKDNPTWDQAEGLQEALSQMPPNLIKACGIETLQFKDLGVSKEYYPNHGYYVANTLVLNSQLKSDPNSYKDDSGKTMDKFEQTLYHELGHGFDDKEGLLSEKKEWLEISGWSKEPKNGLKRVVIDEPGSPKVVGEWYYDPSAGFTRFYAKRNPWDDFADSFCYYVAEMKSFLPKEKIAYFDKKLNKYYGNRSASMNVLSSSLEKLAYSLNGHEDLLVEVKKVYENIRLAEADPAIAKQMTEMLSKKDKNGVPVLFYILNSGNVDKDTATQLKSLAPNVLKTQVNLEGLFGLCKKASEDINKLGNENKADAFLIQRLARVYHGLEARKASLEKLALGPTPKDVEREKLLPRAVKRFISDLRDHSQTILKTKGKSGLEEFMKSYESLRKVKHEIENPKDHFEVNPTGKPSSEPVQNNELKKVQEKTPVKDKPLENKGPSKDKPLEEKKGPGFIKRVVDRFKTKSPDKTTPDRPVKPEEKSKEDSKPIDKAKVEEKPKEDLKPADKLKVEEKSKETPKPADKPEWTGPDRRKKPEETKSEAKPADKVDESKPADKKPAEAPSKDKEPSKDSKPPEGKKYDWKKDKKEKIKGKNWDTSYTWEDFSKLSSDEQKSVISHFDNTADRLQSFGQRRHAKQIDEITNFLESMIEA